MTIDIRTGALAIVALAFMGVSANAAEKMPFEKTKFAQAQSDGKPILIEITAPWCPTCKAQKPILERLAAQPKFKDLKIFEVDFDSRKDVLKELSAQMQSTLIVYKGKTEMGRSTGDTNEASITSLLNKAL